MERVNAGGATSTLVATFNQTTGWSGRTITYEEGQRQFILQDHGPITAEDVLSYDAQGQLEWAHEGLREGVRAFADWQRTPRPGTQAQRRRHSKTLKVVVVLAAIVVVAIVAIAHHGGGGSGSGGGTPSPTPTTRGRSLIPA